MNRLNKIFKTRILLPTAVLFFSLTAFSQSNTKDNSRPDVIYKQLHSSTLSDQQTNLFADGLKLKMNLSIIEEAETAREAWDPAEIPADDLYGGLWINSRVNAYAAIKNEPDSFKVDLTDFSMPAVGHMTSNFGRRGSRRYHYGVDIKAYTGDTIYAAFDGKVRVKAYERGGYGNYIVMRHINGLETVYGHLSKFLTDENEFVKSGQPIGLAGNTGRSFGSHLHFETRFLGKPIDPNFIVDFENKVCHRDEYLVTNNSYKKTTMSSKVVKRSAKDYAKAPSTNKYVAGDVAYYRIKKGDTLGAIAGRHGVSVKTLCNLNNITTRTILRPGKSLRVS